MNKIKRVGLKSPLVKQNNFGNKSNFWSFGYYK